MKLRTIYFPVVVLLLFALFCAPSVGQVNNVLQAGARRLCDLQADIIGDNAQNGYVDTDPDDGGWDWVLTTSDTEHSENPSPTNIYGATCFGLMASLWRGGIKPRFLMGSLDFYLGMEADPYGDSIDSAMDIACLVFMDYLMNNSGFNELARERYDAKVASYGGAEAFGEFIRDYRGGIGQDGLIPYDLGMLVWAAISLEFAFPGQGYLYDAQTYGWVIADDINNPEGYFDIDDPNEMFYTSGLAWAMLAMRWSLVYPPLISVCRTKLLAMQNLDGSWPWNAQYPEGDLQVTAHVVECMGLVDGPGEELEAASGWMAGQQLPTGGWDIWEGEEYPQVNGEICFALAIIPPPLPFGKENGGRPDNAFQRPSFRPRLASPLGF